MGGVVFADITETPTVEPLRSIFRSHIRQDPRQERPARSDPEEFLKEMQNGRVFRRKSKSTAKEVVGSSFTRWKEKEPCRLLKPLLRRFGTWWAAPGIERRTSCTFRDSVDPEGKLCLNSNASYTT